MIGDNPKRYSQQLLISDIRGANLAGWKSILVRTGLHTLTDNDYFDKATYVVDDL